MNSSSSNFSRGIVRALACALLVVCVAGVLPGCIAGVIAENYKRTSTKTVKPLYEGLKGKSFAVVVSAARSIEAEFPGLVDNVAVRVSERLVEHAGASGHVPAARVLKYQYDHPTWTGLRMGELAKELAGVQRIVWIEVSEFRTTDIGNAYEWNGVAAGEVAIYEADSVMPDIRAFERPVRVPFPDKKGIGPDQLTQQQVASVLLARFVDRASWLFYTHEEPYYPDY